MASAQTVHILKQRFREVPNSDTPAAPQDPPVQTSASPDSTPGHETVRPETGTYMDSAAPEIPFVTPPTVNEDSFGVSGDGQPDTPPIAAANVPSMNPGAGVDRAAALQDYQSRLAQIEKKRQVLKTMPITPQDGQTGNPWEVFGTPGDPTGEQAKKEYTDTNGRLRSGLSMALRGLANNPNLRNVRSWGDLANGLAYAGGMGVAGAIKSTADENAKREDLLHKYDVEEAQIRKSMAQDISIQTQTETLKDKVARQNYLDKSLDERIDKRKEAKATADQRNAYGMILRRGYYYEGDNPDEDAKLQSLGIEIPDFDKTHPTYNDQGGVRKAWDTKTRAYVPVSGDTPDDPLIPLEVDGVRLRLKPNEFAQFKVQEGKTQFDAEKDDAKAQQKYLEDYNKHLEDKDKLRAEWLGNNQQQANLDGENADLQKTLDGLDNLRDKDRIKDLRAKIQANKSKIDELNSKNKTIDYNINHLVAPTKPVPTPKYQGAVQVDNSNWKSKGGKNNNVGTESDYQKALNAVGKP